jgi:hypothetical protein
MTESGRCQVRSETDPFCYRPEVVDRREVFVTNERIGRYFAQELRRAGACKRVAKLGLLREPLHKE